MVEIGPPDGQYQAVIHRRGDQPRARSSARGGDDPGVPVPSRGLARPEFESAYENHVGGIYRFAQRRLGPAMAEEITAQTFAEAWRTRDRYQPDRGTPAAWLYGIAANVIRHHRRDEVRQLRALAASGSDPAWVVEDANRVVERLHAGEEWPKVADALAGMKPKDRDIITLYCWEGLSYQEVADALDLPVGTVRSRLSRARTRLAAAVGRSQAGQGEQSDG